MRPFMKSQVFYVAVTNIFVNILTLFTHLACRFLQYIEDRHEIVRFLVNRCEAIMAAEWKDEALHAGYTQDATILQFAKT